MTGNLEEYKSLEDCDSLDEGLDRDIIDFGGGEDEGSTDIRSMSSRNRSRSRSA